jgi:hypothetical protein
MAKLTEKEIIERLGKQLEAANKLPPVPTRTGACIYNAGGSTYCAVLTQAQCAGLNGIWTEGQACPG